MPGYMVASGSSIRWSGGVVMGGQPVPAELLAVWDEETVKANLAAGSIVADAPAPRKAGMVDDGTLVEIDLPLIPTSKRTITAKVANRGAAE